MPDARGVLLATRWCQDPDSPPWARYKTPTTWAALLALPAAHGWSEVADVLVNLEHAIVRAKKAAKRLEDTPQEHNAKLALADAQATLESARSRLQKDTYFAGNELRLV